MGTNLRRRERLADTVPQCERRADGALSIVVVRFRDAKHAHDGIANEFLDGAAVGRERFAHRARSARQRPLNELGILGVRIAADPTMSAKRIVTSLRSSGMAEAQEERPVKRARSRAGPLPQEYFVQDDWRLSDRVTVNAGLRYTLNFPSTEAHNQAAVFNLETQELEYLGRDGHPRAARQLHKLNFGPRLGVVGRVTEKTVVRTGYAIVWIEMAGITTPFTTPVFPFLQTVSQRTLDNITPAFTLAAGPSVQPIPLTPTAALGQGVFAVDRDLGSGYVQQWNTSHSGSSRRTSPSRPATLDRRSRASGFLTRT